MATLHSSSATIDVELPFSLEHLLLALVAIRQSPSSAGETFGVAGYRTDYVSISSVWGGPAVEAKRDDVKALIEYDYFEWVVPPVMIHRLDVTLAGRRYVEEVLAGSAIHLETRQHGAA